MAPGLEQLWESELEQTRGMLMDAMLANQSAQPWVAETGQLLLEQSWARGWSTLMDVMLARQLAQPWVTETGQV